MAKNPSKEEIENTLVQVSNALKSAKAVELPKAIDVDVDSEPVMQQVQQTQATPTQATNVVQPKTKERARTPVSESRGIAMGSFK